MPDGEGTASSASSWPQHVTEVASRAGHANPSKFAAAFRKQFGGALPTSEIGYDDLIVTNDELEKARNVAKARRAAASPERPGEKCRAEPGRFVPVVNRTKCEGKSDCVVVCPYDVFEVRRIENADFAGLGLLGKLKSMAHGRKTSYTPRASACQSCGLCVVACPEDAIELVLASRA